MSRRCSPWPRGSRRSSPGSLPAGGGRLRFRTARPPRSTRRHARATRQAIWTFEACTVPSLVERGLNSLSPVLGEQRERVASGGMPARSLHESCRRRCQDVRLWEVDAIAGWEDGRGAERGEGQVGRAEALATEVLAAVGEQLSDVVELVEDRGLVFVLGLSADGERAPDEPAGKRPSI